MHHFGICKAQESSHQHPILQQDVQMVQRELQSLRIQTGLCTLNTEHTVLHDVQEKKSSFRKRPVTLTKMYCLCFMNVCNTT